MTQATQLGEAELDTFVRVDRRNGTREFYRVVGETSIPITAADYAAATEGN